jgi:hypothetical protein
MGKVITSIIIGIFISLALALFNGSGAQPTSLLLVVLGPQGWDNSQFMTLLFGNVFAVAIGAIAIGAGAIIKQDWVVRAGGIAALSGVIMAPFLDLYQFFVAHGGYLSEVGCVGAPICSHLDAIGGIGQFIALIFVGPIFIYSLWNCLEWVWKGDT